MIFCEAVPYQNANAPDVHPVFRGKRHVHLMSDDEHELRVYATQIGLKVGWLQRDAFGLAHYDVTGGFMVRVLNDPKVVKMDRVTFVKAFVRLRHRCITRIRALRSCRRMK